MSNCQQLESIEVLCRNGYLNETESVVKYSSKKFNELKKVFTGCVESKSFSGELEPIFISWVNRLLQKSLVIIIIKADDGIDSLEIKEESIEMIENFKKFNIMYFKISVIN